MMSDKRFEWNIVGIFDNKTNHFYYKIFDEEEVVDLLNEQEEEISYWKHRVSSLLFILSQFDNEKVKKLLEELDEREEI